MSELRLPKSLSADDYLDLVTTVNRRRNRSNARLRGLGAIAGVTPRARADSGFDSSLRSYSKAKDEEIIGKIMGHAADFNFPSENDYRDWYSDRGFPEKMYEASVAEYRKRAGRRESALASRAAQATAKHQDTMRPGQIKRQEQEIAKEEQRVRDADVDEAMIGVVKRAAEDDITSIQNSDDPSSAYNEIVRKRLGRKGSAGWEKAHADFYKQLMEISGLKPTEVTPTGAMKSQLEKRGLVAPVSEGTFDQMTPEDAAQTRQNYLSLTQIIKSDQRQNVLLQGLTEGPMAKNTYDQINMIYEIEDPQFFQRVFEVDNPYELYAKFKEMTEGLKPDRVKEIEEEFIRRASQKSGWEPDHIYSLIRPEKFGVGAKYSRYRFGG